MHQVDGGLLAPPTLSPPAVLPLDVVASTSDSIVADILVASVRKRYDEQSALFPSHRSAVELSTIVGHLRNQIETEVRFSAPFFAEIHKRPLPLILGSFANCVREDCKNCTSKELSDDVVKCMASLRDFDTLLEHHGLKFSSTTLEPGTCAPTMQAFSGLVCGWIEDQRKKFDECLKRCVAMEEECGWRPALGTVCHSTSVLDLFSLFTQTVDHFIGMDFVWEECFVSLVEHIVESAINYANMVYTSCSQDFVDRPACPCLCKPRSQARSKLTAGLRPCVYL